MRYFLPVIILLITLSCNSGSEKTVVTTAELLNEMIDLERLTMLPSQGYRTVQYSSYDRRSKSPSDSGWFSNEDGFGSEPIPGFEEVIRQPDSSGIGEYLICDIKSPGAILRLWTANINGKIRLYIDNMESPVYDGNAQDFFWKTIRQLSGRAADSVYDNAIRQFDATYFPVAFSERCRILWIGDISKIHFYHVGVRIYDPDIKVETFNPDNIEKYLLKLNEVVKYLASPESVPDKINNKRQPFENVITAGEKKIIFTENGEKAIRFLSVKVKASDIEKSLRQNILSVWFDNSSIPQVEAPLGDFFGAAPGLNPYESLPFSVNPDGTLVSRFVMPFRQNVRIEIENMSGSDIEIKGEVKTGSYEWEEGRSMHFRARWRIDHGLTASYFNEHSYNVSDILYLMASGKGRLTGIAAFIYNPSNATTSWGNWWGEGDEKIFVDRDTFPSFYGTGSEDYFNYSWSSTRIFSYPYCGQPRNDGPGNRGYVSNYRWHISDDILFTDKLAFYMELGHHGIVHNFSYGRIAYYYALPGSIDDYRRISVKDIESIPYNSWKPIAYLGSAGYRYIQAEDVIKKTPAVKTERGKLWADDKIVVWTPLSMEDKLVFNLESKKGIEKTNIGFTMSHNPSGGIISVYLNGRLLKIDGKQETDLFEPYQTILVNHFSEKTDLMKGLNEVIFEAKDTIKGHKTGIDFIWMKED